ncbi:hypothetical protein CIK06_04615 [Plantactinospora sp. KBS50]|nr:hypothetical protein CIK06_04615 [Plantactinospora sp. KBS50]
MTEHPAEPTHDLGKPTGPAEDTPPPAAGATAAGGGEPPPGGPGWVPPGQPSGPPPGGASFTSRYGLVRPQQGRYLAGVCAAIGRATATDPVLWRVLLAVLGFFGGIGILVYLAAWLIIPAEGDTASPLEAMLGRGRSSMSPITVIVLGVLTTVLFGLIVTDKFRAVLLGTAIVIGGALLLNRTGNGRPDRAGGPPPVPPAGPPGAGWPDQGDPASRRRASRRRPAGPARPAPEQPAPRRPAGGSPAGPSRPAARARSRPPGTRARAGRCRRARPGTGHPPRRADPSRRPAHSVPPWTADTVPRSRRAARTPARP